MTRFQQLLVSFSSWALALLMLGWFAVVVGGMVTGWRPKPSWIFSLFFMMILAVLIAAWGKWMRERYVREGPLPHFLKRKLRDEFPALSGKDADLVERGLRQFFLACVRSGKKPVAMPSVIVSHLWRIFAGHTSAYEDWCKVAFGSALAVSPVRRLGGDAEHNDQLRRTWYWACKEEAIQPNDPSRLPILFALDTKLSILGGITYFAHAQDFYRHPNHGDGAEVYYGTSFSDDQYVGSNSDFGGADGGGDGGGGDGGDGGGGGD